MDICVPQKYQQICIRHSSLDRLLDRHQGLKPSLSQQSVSKYIIMHMS